VHFNGLAAKNHYELLFDDGYKPIQIQNPNAFESKIDRLCTISEANNIKSVVLVSSIMSEILSDVFDNKFSDKNIDRFSNHNREIVRTIKYIEENYSKDISLDKLTKAANLSKYHFSRIFKAHIGTSPYDYLLNFRINKSKELLAKTDLSIGQISGRVGFAEYNNYIRAFTKSVGMPPLKYRKSRNNT
jgi:AraC-like DNA-binding protein